MFKIGGLDVTDDKRTGWHRMWKECGSLFVVTSD
jgi:hypothetical protein